MSFKGYCIPLLSVGSTVLSVCGSLLHVCSSLTSIRAIVSAPFLCVISLLHPAPFFPILSHLLVSDIPRKLVLGTQTHPSTNTGQCNTSTNDFDYHFLILLVPHGKCGTMCAKRQFLQELTFFLEIGGWRHATTLGNYFRGRALPFPALPGFVLSSAAVPCPLLPSKFLDTRKKCVHCLVNRFNVTLLNGLGVKGRVVGVPQWVSTRGPDILDVRVDYSDQLWPWSGYMAIDLTVKTQGCKHDGVPPPIPIECWIENAKRGT